MHRYTRIMWHKENNMYNVWSSLSDPDIQQARLSHPFPPLKDVMDRYVSMAVPILCRLMAEGRVWTDISSR